MPRISSSFIKSYFLVLVFTALEMLALRVFLHSSLEMQIGWQGMTDFDVAVPIAVALFISLLVLNQSNVWVAKIQKPFFFANLALTTCFLILSMYVAWTGQHTALTYATWVFLLLSVFLSSLCVFVHPSHYVANANSWVVFPAMVLSVAVVLYQHYYEVLWPSLIPLTGKASCMVLKPLLGSSLRCAMTDSMNMVLKEKYFWADIAAGCSGLDGQLFFLVSFLILFSLYSRTVKPAKWGLFLVLGPLFIFWANVFRIAVFFLIGAGTARTEFYEFGRNTMLFLFHTHSGWVLYSASVLFLQYVVLIPSEVKAQKKIRLSNLKASESHS